VFFFVIRNYSPLPSPPQVGEGTVTGLTKLQFLPNWGAVAF
jgi:hypothetical protein